MQYLPLVYLKLKLFENIIRNVLDVYFYVPEEYLDSIKHLMVLGRLSNLSVGQGALIRLTKSLKANQPML